MNSIDVSFIVTCYNFENYIKAAIESILAQECNYTIEIIIVDDASIDSSVKIIQQFTHNDHITFIQHSTNTGASVSINEAFAISKGKYICRFDGDDKWQPDFLATLIPILEQNPDVGMVFGNYIPIDADGVTATPQKVARPAYLQQKDNDFNEILKKYYINAPTIIFRKEALETVFPIPLKFGNFLDWYVSLSVLRNWKSYYYDQALAYYRVHHTNNHRRAVMNGTDEKVTALILQEFLLKNSIFKETDKRKIIASHYHDLAMKYYSADMPKDANRCFYEAFKHKKSYLGNPRFIQFYVINTLGKKRYEKLKQYVKR